MTAQSTKGSRRANGDGLIRQRADGRWEGRIMLPSGKTKSVYAKTQREVQRKLQDIRQQLRENRVVSTERQTVAQFLNRWLEDVVRQKNSPKTYEDYESIVRVHIIPGVGRYRLTELPLSTSRRGSMN